MQLNQFLSADDLAQFNDDDIKYTLLQLLDAGFIKGKPRYGGNQLTIFSCGGLTWQGHQFIDTIRDPKIWRKTKEAASKLESASITILSSLASTILSKFLGL